MKIERNLTKFLCKEMLYDYVSGNLDSSSKKAVEEYLNKDKECQKEMKALEVALKYTGDLSETKISEPFYVEIKENKSKMTRLFEVTAWKNWPDVAKWSVQALSVGAIVAVLGMMVPWNKLTDKVERPVVQKVQEVEKEKPVVEEKSEAVAKVETKEEVQKVEKPAEVKVEKPKPVVQAPVKAVVAKKEKKASSGEVTRSFMQIDNIEELAPEIVNKIATLGGEKAGRVPLGWRKPGGNYFHIKMPKENYAAFTEYLENFGQIRSYTDRHKRVMPEGVIRIILEIKDNSAKKN